MNPHDLDLLGTCCAIEAIADGDVGYWPDSARALLAHAKHLAARTRDFVAWADKLAVLARERDSEANGRREAMAFQGSN